MAAVAPKPASLATASLARNILVAYDGSRGGAHALAYAAALARAGHACMTVITVVPWAPYPTPGVVGAYDPRECETAMCKQLREAIESIPDDVSVTTVVSHGNAAHEIVRQAEKGQHDLVVLGYEGHGPFKGAVGGVCAKVLKHSKAPVLVVHPPPA
jgi:nucleotide-binding universal stress UspA family protein